MNDRLASLTPWALKGLKKNTIHSSIPTNITQVNGTTSFRHNLPKPTKGDNTSINEMESVST